MYDVTSERLELLLKSATQGEWVYKHNYPFNIYSDDEKQSIIGTMGGFDTTPRRTHEKASNAVLSALAPQMARKVIAAEKLIEALELIEDSPENEYTDNCTVARMALACYRSVK